MIGDFSPNTPENDDLFARPPRRSIPLPPRQTCAVCGLGSSALVCEMCIEHTASSIVWLEKLPTLSMKEQQALDQLHATQPNRENYFDGEWRPVTDLGYAAMEKLRNRGFELGSDRYGKLMARWPIAPAAPTETGYWVSLDYATFGLWETNGIVTDAAPIARKASMGRPIADVLTYYRQKGARIEKLSEPQALTFSGIALEYWREEVRLECAVSLARLKRICQERNADFDRTIAGLQKGT